MLGDPQRDGAEPGWAEHVPAVLAQDAFGDGLEPAGRDGPEHVGEEVEPDIVEVVDEALPAAWVRRSMNDAAGPNSRVVLKPTWR